MAIVPSAFIEQNKLKANVRKAERALQPDVVRIMYSVTEDWRGEISLFFRIVLSDHASAPGKLRETTQRVTQKIRQQVKTDDLGLVCYFSFRSKSEQAALRDPFWERR